MRERAIERIKETRIPYFSMMMTEGINATMYITLSIYTRKVKVPLYMY